MRRAAARVQQAPGEPFRWRAHRARSEQPLKAIARATTRRWTDGSSTWQNILRLRRPQIDVDPRGSRSTRMRGTSGTAAGRKLGLWRRSQEIDKMQKIRPFLWFDT